MLNTLCVVSEEAISREGLVRIAVEDGFDAPTAAACVSDIDWSEIEESVVVVLDIRDGNRQSAAVRQVTMAQPLCRPVVLSDRFEYSSALQCFREGAQGYILRDVECKPLICSLRLVALGQKVIPPLLIDAIQQQSIPQHFGVEAEENFDRANLSQREVDVLCCLMSGMSNKVIARELVVSEATIKVHVKAILRKLKVGNRTQAAIWGASRGIPNHC